MVNIKTENQLNEQGLYAHDLYRISAVYMGINTDIVYTTHIRIHIYLDHASSMFTLTCPHHIKI